uniref:Uncharacterized protein n=1 Tax=Trypanosoma vivax (strain Y486) TaxID=1055687 RepID=G0U1D3_TRYVY|nr:hypothetical protein, unlikely [Trypanosoma vivax Y486]
MKIQQDEAHLNNDKSIKNENNKKEIKIKNRYCNGYFPVYSLRKLDGKLTPLADPCTNVNMLPRKETVNSKLAVLLRAARFNRCRGAMKYHCSLLLLPLPSFLLFVSSNFPLFLLLQSTTFSRMHRQKSR